MWILWAWLATAASAEPIEGYCRQPDVHGDRVVFVAEGDLFMVPRSGGLAHRLTRHPELESTPHFSRDGRWLAFVGRREGVPDLYVMPADSGAPRRLTYDGQVRSVEGFTPDGRVLVQSDRFVTLPGAELLAVDVQTGAQERIPLFRASEGAFGPGRREGQAWSLYFTRLRRQSSHNKRYRGGWMRRIWRWGPKESEATPLTEGPGWAPEVVGGRVVFLSDQDGTTNLWSMAFDGTDLRQHTSFRGVGVREFGSDGTQVILRVGPDLYTLAFPSGTEARRLRIQLRTDLDRARRRFDSEPFTHLQGASLAPDGSRVALTVRGRGFVVPTSPGRTVRVQSHAAARIRELTFFGDALVAFSDGSDSREMNLTRYGVRGRSPAESLTDYGPGFRSELTPSPDGGRIAFRDRSGRLQLFDARTGVTITVARSPHGPLYDLAWSADSRWLAYVSTEKNQRRTIRLFDTRTGRQAAVTSGRVDSYSPAFSPDGKTLYFLSDRRLRSVVPSPWGTYQPEPFFDQKTKILGLPLGGPARSPFAPVDELHPADPKDSDPKSDSNAPTPTASVQFGGALDRVFDTPFPPDNYRDLTVGDGRLFVARQETPYGGQTDLVTLKIQPVDAHGPKVETVLRDLEGYALSRDRSHLLLRKEKKLFVVKAGARVPDDLSEHALDLSSVVVPVEPQKEWRQMFHEAWRLQRDYFYDPGLHGVDWNAMKARYLPWVERVTDRHELNDVLSSMVSELAALHTFVFGGDSAQDPIQVEAATLGARLQPEKGGYRVEHVYVNDPDRVDLASPLSRALPSIREGDLIEAVNGRPVNTPGSLEARLQGQAGQQVLLSVRRRNRTWENLVIPLTSSEDRDLRYSEWEHTRRLRVEERGRGRIGYVHLRSMGRDDMAAWAQQFHAVQDRPALIVDVRNNRGGNIDSWILSRLLRQAWFYWKPRHGTAFPNMQHAFRGHRVVLVNERTASDGEAFAEGFRRLGLGPIYGARTWGGEIWLSFNTGLVDGGMVSVAQTGVYGPEGAWLIEGHGVEPDVRLVADPHRAFLGEDAVLDRAIDDLLRKLDTDPRPIPSPPPYPDKDLEPKAP